MNFQPLKDFLDGYLPMLGVPGSDTVIYRNHEEVFRYQSGYDNIKIGTPVRKDALYNIYSCSKVALGVAATQLIERGEIVVSDPLYAYFPEYRDMEVFVRDGQGNKIGTKKAENPILIKHLLTMTSGMGYNFSSDSVKRVVKDTQGRAPTLDVCRAIAENPLDFEPGTDYQYSYSLDVMGGVIELVTGMKFSEYMRENIFEPLGMKDTSYHIPPEKYFRMATQYNYDSAERAAVELPFTSNAFRLGSEFDGAGAGIISSVDDYILLADALANGGVGKNGNRIISRFGIELMRTNSLDEHALKTFNNSGPYLRGYGYGYGVRMNLHPELAGNVAPVGEFGWDGAKMCLCIADPSNKIAVFHAEHMGGVHDIVIPRLRNLIYSCFGE